MFLIQLNLLLCLVCGGLYLEQIKDLLFFKITVPFIYIMPEYGLYSMETVNFNQKNVKGGFILENIYDTTHSLLMEKPHEIAECITYVLI